MAVHDAALEGPQPEAVVDLVAPPRDGGEDVAAGRVPLDVRAHEVVVGAHHREVAVMRGRRDVRGETTRRGQYIMDGRPRKLTAGAERKMF